MKYAAQNRRKATVIVSLTGLKTRAKRELSESKSLNRLLTLINADERKVQRTEAITHTVIKYLCCSRSYSARPVVRPQKHKRQLAFISGLYDDSFPRSPLCAERHQREAMALNESRPTSASSDWRS